MSAYDSWLCTDPSQEGPVCALCGGNLRVERWQCLTYYKCEDCEAETNPPDEPEEE